MFPLETELSLHFDQLFHDTENSCGPVVASIQKFLSNRLNIGAIRNAIQFLEENISNSGDESASYSGNSPYFRMCDVCTQVGTHLA